MLLVRRVSAKIGPDSMVSVLQEEIAPALGSAGGGRVGRGRGLLLRQWAVSRVASTDKAKKGKCATYVPRVAAGSVTSVQGVMGRRGGVRLKTMSHSIKKLMRRDSNTTHLVHRKKAKAREPRHPGHEVARSSV